MSDASHTELEPRPAGERTVRIGGIIAAVGAVAAIVGLLPLVFPAVPSAPIIWFVAIGGVGIGVAMSLWGMVRAARGRSRALRPHGDETRV